MSRECKKKGIYGKSNEKKYCVWGDRLVLKRQG